MMCNENSQTIFSSSGGLVLRCYVDRLVCEVIFHTTTCSTVRDGYGTIAYSQKNLSSNATGLIIFVVAKTEARAVPTFDIVQSQGLCGNSPAISSQ